MTLLETPDTSSIMQRRNSQLNRENQSAATTPLLAQQTPSTPPIVPTTSTNFSASPRIPNERTPTLPPRRAQSATMFPYPNPHQ